jgi:uncharacterized membrane protein YgcG
MRRPWWPPRPRTERAAPDRDGDAGEADRAMAGLLERYAEGPLSPDEASLARMRAKTMAAFRASRGTESPQPVAAAASARPLLRRRQVLAVAFAVVVLTLSTVGVAAAASGPGQPFYRTRLAVEAWFLPSAGTDARLTADLDRAQARLNETSQAAAAGDDNAAADAMGAYLDVVDSISVPDDEASRQQLQRRLGEQLATLQRLRGRAHGQAAGEMDQAMDRVGWLLGGSGGQRGPGATGADGGPQASPGGAGASSGGGSGSGGGQGGQGGPNQSPGQGRQGSDD